MSRDEVLLKMNRVYNVRHVMVEGGYITAEQFMDEVLTAIEGMGVQLPVSNSHSGPDGWRCSKSPDAYCHYYTKMIDGVRLVELLDGTFHPTPIDAQPMCNETDDACLFCGNPSERK